MSSSNLQNLAKDTLEEKRKLCPFKLLNLCKGPFGRYEKMLLRQNSKSLKLTLWKIIENYVPNLFKETLGGKEKNMFLQCFEILLSNICKGTEYYIL